MTAPAERLEFADVESLHDLLTFAGRAQRVDTDGAIRLQSVGGVLAAWVCVVPGSGLLGEGTVLGLRTMRARAVPEDLDRTVALASVQERAARRASTGDVSSTLAMPPSAVRTPWTAVAPPRSGWEPAGQVELGVLRDAVRAGVEEISTGVPEHAGAAAVADLRRRVWGRGLDPLGLPAGAAFGADALGFLPPADAAGPEAEAATVLRHGRWWRLTLPVGHVLVG